MPKLALFVCADKAFGAKTVNPRTAARTALHSVLATQAYRCKNFKEWQDLQPICRTQRMWSALLVEEDDGRLRHVTENDSLLVATLPTAAEGQRIEVTPEPISQTSDAGSSDAPGGPVVAAHTSEAETTLADSTEEAQSQEVADTAEAHNLDSEGSTPSPATTQEEPKQDDRLDRIKAELAKGPSRLAALARDTGIAQAHIEELASITGSGFIVQGPPAKWCKLT